MMAKKKKAAVESIEEFGDGAANRIIDTGITQTYHAGKVINGKFVASGFTTRAGSRPANNPPSYYEQCLWSLENEIKHKGDTMPDDVRKLADNCVRSLEQLIARDKKVDPFQVGQVFGKLEVWELALSSKHQQARNGRTAKKTAARAAKDRVSRKLAVEAELRAQSDRGETPSKERAYKAVSKRLKVSLSTIKQSYLNG